MSLVVESGTGLSNAESYVSVVDANTFHTRMGNAAWTGTDTVKEQALRKATRYVDLFYYDRWQGYRIKPTQALQWPRYNVYDRDTNIIDPTSIPQAIKDAVAEMALRSLSEDILPDLEGAGEIASESIRVGPITDAKTYTGGGKSQIKKYATCDLLVQMFLHQGRTVERA